MIDNKWLHGDVLIKLPDLHSTITSSYGLKPVPLIMDENVGEETVLLIVEPDHLINEFQGKKKIRLDLKTGVVNTSYGPVMFFLYIIPDPVRGDDVVYENSIDPKSVAHLHSYVQLANQRYWHLVVVDSSSVVHNFFELSNQFGLKRTLDRVQEAVKEIDQANFLAAKAEYENRYSISDLLSM